MNIFDKIGHNWQILCGVVGGSGITIAIDWNNIFEHAIEGSIIAICGGFCGALGGWIFKKISKGE